MSDANGETVTGTDDDSHTTVTGPHRVTVWRQTFEQMTPAQKIDFYDSHNGDTRFSNDLNQRLFGVCGCYYCGEIRKTWANNPAPINDQRRKGSNSMSSINVCDRCGGLVTGAALGQITVRTSADAKVSETVHAEICPGCVTLFVELVETPVDPAQKTPYKAPWARPKSKTEEAEEESAVRKLVRTIVEEVADAQKAIAAPTVVADSDPAQERIDNGRHWIDDRRRDEPTWTPKH